MVLLNRNNAETVVFSLAALRDGHLRLERSMTMKKSLFAFVAALIAFNALPTVGQAQTVCGSRADFVKKLQKGYAEKPVSVGLASNGSMIEVFASENGTFSIVITQPSGNTCLVAAGDNWQSAPSRKAEIRL
jgi:hypothetical protein